MQYTLKEKDGKYQWRQHAESPCECEALSPVFDTKQNAIEYQKRMPMITNREWEATGDKIESADLRAAPACTFPQDQEVVSASVAKNLLQELREWRQMADRDLAMRLTFEQHAAAIRRKP